MGALFNNKEQESAEGRCRDGDHEQSTSGATGKRANEKASCNIPSLHRANRDAVLLHRQGQVLSLTERACSLHSASTFQFLPEWLLSAAHREQSLSPCRRISPR